MTTRLVGEPIARKEDPRLLRGEGRYLDDLGHDALRGRDAAQPPRPRAWCSTST
jgi:aerobic carbon-monoxide dehydrogenase large subunit